MSLGRGERKFGEVVRGEKIGQKEGKGGEKERNEGEREEERRGMEGKRKVNMEKKWKGR